VYVAIAVVVLYMLFGAILLWSLSHLGIAAPQQEIPRANTADALVLQLMIGGVVIGAGILWGLKVLLSN